MIYTTLTNKAMRIAYNAHHGQLDCNGVPYIFHPFHVAEQMSDEISACVALLHDVIEDTELTLDDLKGEFPEEVIEAVDLLTHDEGVDYYEYLRRLKMNPYAKSVKLADIAHNSDMSRITDPTAVTEQKKMHWQEKYALALRILKEGNI